MKKIVEFIGVGRRKCAVSAVRLRKGSGNIDVNGRKFEEYFTCELQRKAIMEPMERFGSPEKYDMIIRTKGGGIPSQSEACRLGISRAMVKEDEELRKSLKGLGFLTRDPRKKERKKYGLAGARKRFQFSKR